MAYIGINPLTSIVIVSSAGSAGVFTSLSASESATISANSSGAALTITQTGGGPVLVVEDSASVDSTPLSVDTNGNLSVGGTITSTFGISSGTF